MMNVTRFLAAAAAVGSLAAPASAQYYAQPTYPPAYPQYQQQYPQYQQGYPQTGYSYGEQAYGQSYSQNPIQSVIDSLLGNRYTVTDRQAVSRCASAALAQAQAQYAGRNGYGAYGNAYGQPQYGQQYGQQYTQGYNRYSALRVTAITNVQRRSSGVRVSGMMSSGANTAYGSQYGYQSRDDDDRYDQNRAYAAGELSFRCNVDYRGAVTGLRVRPTDSYGG